MDVFWFFIIYILGFLWFLIIPEWLIDAPRWIAILFESFLELPKMSNIDPWGPYLLQKYFKHIRNMFSKTSLVGNPCI